MQVKSKVNVKVYTIDVPFLLIQIWIHCDRSHGSRALNGIDIEIPFVMHLLILDLTNKFKLLVVSRLK
jgi:hypothetical protein